MLIVIFIYLVMVSSAIFLWYKAQQQKFKRKQTVYSNIDGFDGDLLIISFIPFVNIITIAVLISRLYGDDIIELLDDHFRKSLK